MAGNLLGERLRSLRLDCNLDRDALGAQAGCSSAYLSFAEKGEVIPSERMLSILAGILNGDLPKLMKLREDAEDPI